MGKTLLKKVKYQKRERKNIYSTKTEESHKIKTTKVSSTYCLKQNHPTTTRSNLHIKVIKESYNYEWKRKILSNEENSYQI